MRWGGGVGRRVGGGPFQTSLDELLIDNVKATITHAQEVSSDSATCHLVCHLT